MEWLRIGEVARRSGLTTRTLRHYDELGLLMPSGRSTGDYRLYGPEDLDRLLAIQHLKSLGLSLEEIGAALDEPGFAAADALGGHIAAVEARIAAERDLLDRLHRLRDAAGVGWDEVLDVIALTERLRHPEAAVRFRAALDAPTRVPVEDLLDLLRGDPAAGVREGATWALVQHGPDAVEAVVAELGDPDPVVRHQMAHVLGKFADPRAIGALVALLEDPDVDVVAKAAFALGQIGGPDAAGALAGMLGRGSATLRATVVTALGRLGADAAEPLSVALASPLHSARADAAEAVGHLESLGEQEEALVAALRRLTADRVQEVRLAALMALGGIDSPAARAAIAEAGNHEDPRTRLLAGRLGGQ